MPFPDDDDNHRLDGSQDGISRHVSDGEDHSDIILPEGQGVAWAIAQLEPLVGG